MQTAPLHHDLADGPDGGRAFWLSARDGVRLRVAHWGGNDLKGTVLLFPGRTEYIEKYGRAAADIMARGYATATIDWRGQGLAERVHDNRLVGHVLEFEDYQHDVAAMLDHVVDMGLPEPYFLIAHSMGGCIGLRALINGLPVRAATFSAPMWGIMMAPALRPMATGLAAISSVLGIADKLVPGQSSETYVKRAPFEGNTLTSDPDMFAYMQAQVSAVPDLALGAASLRWLNEALAEMRALEKLPSPDCPCLTVLGTEEAIVEPGPIRKRMAHWPSGELKILQGARHEVMMEVPATRTKVFDAAAQLFDAYR